MLAASFLALALAAAPETACADAPAGVRSSVRVMLLDLKGSGPQYMVARSLGQVVASEAAQVKGYELLSSEEVRAVLEGEANKQLVGCDESGCLAELAEAMDADLLITGSLEQSADGAPLLSLSLLNTRALVTVNRVTLSWPGDPARLPDLARAAAQLLVREKRDRPEGHVVLTGVPLDAQVFVDDVDRTEEARTGRIGGLEVGPHVVRVTALDRLPREEHVLLVAGGSAQVDGALEPVPVTASSWFWIGAGAAVVAGVGATAVGLYAIGRSSVTAVAAVPAYGLGDVDAIKAGAR